LDSNPTAAYRFGILSGLMSRPHMSGLKLESLPPGEMVSGRPVREFPRCGPAPLEFDPVNFLFFPPIRN
jgi:hypothetical protein